MSRGIKQNFNRLTGGLLKLSNFFSTRNCKQKPQVDIHSYLRELSPVQGLVFEDQDSWPSELSG